MKPSHLFVVSFFSLAPIMAGISWYLWTIIDPPSLSILAAGVAMSTWSLGTIGGSAGIAEHFGNALTMPVVPVETKAPEPAPQLQPQSIPLRRLSTADAIKADLRVIKVSGDKVPHELVARVVRDGHNEDTEIRELLYELVDRDIKAPLTEKLPSNPAQSITPPQPAGTGEGVTKQPTPGQTPPPAGPIPSEWKE